VLAVLGPLGLANLVLTVGLLRRLRRQNALMQMSIDGVANPEPIMLVAGEEVRPFAATTVAGARVGTADLHGRTLVAFLSPTCPSCIESLPLFTAKAQLVPGGAEQVLAVVVGHDHDTAELRERLEPVAFGVVGFPAFAVLDEHTVAASHFALERLPETAAA
jgi:thiol-disulfide isomerase/thioredoxin